MPTAKATIDFLLDQLSGLHGLTTRRMFGEYCVYLFGTPIGFVSDDELHVKMTDAGLQLAPQVRQGFPYPDAKPHLLIPADLWEEREWLAELIQATAANLPMPARRKKQFSRPA